MATTTLYEKKFLYKLTGDAQEQNSKSSAIYGMINPLKWCYSAIKDRNVSDIINHTNMQLNLWVNRFQYLILLRLQKPF
jgi:hypothetical protein